MHLVGLLIYTILLQLSPLIFMPDALSRGDTTLVRLPACASFPHSYLDSIRFTLPYKLEERLRWFVWAADFCQCETYIHTYITSTGCVSLLSLALLPVRQDKHCTFLSHRPTITNKAMTLY